jgi:hypothetical protein
MISTLKVLNTVTALGTDVSVGADGILNIAGGAVADAYNVRNVSINTSVAETAGIITITPTTVTASLPYAFYISGFSKSTGLPKTMNVSFTSSPSPSATTISAQAIAIINADTDFSVTAAGSATIVLTSTAGYPLFTVGGSSDALTSTGNESAQTITTTLTATNGTVGVIGAGLGSSLQAKYAYAAAGNALIYNELANLTTTSYYTEIVIDYLGTGYSGSGAFRGEISTNQAVVLVLFGTTAQSAGATTTPNYSDLLGAYGTVVGLQAGYRVVGALMTAATATSTNTSGVQTLNSGGLGTVNGVIGGDYIVSVSTPVVHKVISTLTENTYLASTTTSLTTSSTLNSFKWRNLPL